jgi:hypothetical protein
MMRGKGRLTVMALSTVIIVAHGPIAAFAQSTSALQAQQQLDSQRQAKQQRQIEQQRYIDQRAEEQRRDQIREQRQQEAREREVVLLQQQRAQADAEAERKRKTQQDADDQPSVPRVQQRTETQGSPGPAAVAQQVNLNPSGLRPSSLLLAASISIGLLAGAIAVILGKMIQRRFLIERH